MWNMSIKRGSLNGLNTWGGGATELQAHPNIDQVGPVERECQETEEAQHAHCRDKNVMWTGFYLNWLWQLRDSAGLEAGKEFLVAERVSMIQSRCEKVHIESGCLSWCPREGAGCRETSFLLSLPFTSGNFSPAFSTWRDLGCQVEDLQVRFQLSPQDLQIMCSASAS